MYVKTYPEKVDWYWEEVDVLFWKLKPGSGLLNRRFNKVLCPEPFCVWWGVHAGGFATLYTQRWPIVEMLGCHLNPSNVAGSPTCLGPVGGSTDKEGQHSRLNINLEL